jgi:integrase/recombinase XerD
VEQFCVDSQAQGDGAAVIRRRLAALTSFFGHAVAAGDRADNPAEEVERPMLAAVSPPAELDRREAQGLLGAAEDLGPKASVLVGLLLVDGLKLGEALAIDVDDLGADPATVTVSRQGRRESLALHTTTASAIAAYTHGRVTGPLLAGNDAAGTRLTRSGAHQIVKRASTRAGITKSVSANTLRRYFASSAYRDGASVDDIRASLGVGERRTTRRLLPQQP